MKRVFYILFSFVLVACSSLQKVEERPTPRRSTVFDNDSKEIPSKSSETREKDSSTKDTSTKDLAKESTANPSTSDPNTSSPRASSSGQEAVEPLSFNRSQVIAHARSHLGVPYRYGGCTTDGLDCSGLIQNAFASIGVILPRVSRDQAKHGKKSRKAYPGDVVVFAEGGKIMHIGLVTASSPQALYVIHSTSSKGVIEENVMASSYWRSRIHGYRNILGPIQG